MLPFFSKLKRIVHNRVRKWISKKGILFPWCTEHVKRWLIEEIYFRNDSIGFWKNFVILYAWYFLPEPEGPKDYDYDFCLNKFPFLKHYIYIRGTIRTFSRRRCFISKFIQLRACINCNYIYWEIAWKWKLFFFVLYFTSSLMRWERVSWQVHAYILMATAFREITLFETKS